MATLRQTTLHHQITGIVTHHVDALKQYLSVEISQPLKISDDIFSIADQLTALCAQPPQNADRELYKQVVSQLEALETFLGRMNQALNASFIQTPVGRVWWSALQWYKKAAEHQRGLLSIEDVWDILEPAVPDVLEAAEGQRYIAKWWKPVPPMDIEIMMRTDEILIHGQPFEPQDLPNGLAICFSVLW